jgi:hypothetical protein
MIFKRTKEINWLAGAGGGRPVDNWRGAAKRPRLTRSLNDERKFAVGHRRLQKHARCDEAGNQHNGL